MKIVKHIQPKIGIFTDVKNRCMLHGRVFVMYQWRLSTIYWKSELCSIFSQAFIAIQKGLVIPLP